MPGMDGFEMLRNLIDRHGKDATHAIAVTASVFEHQHKRYLESGFAGFIDKPVRVEQIHACLAEQLGVEFEYTREADSSVERDWQDVRLPEDLQTDLQAAVAAQNITQVIRHIDGMANLGTAEEHLASRLRELARQFDLAGIKSALEKIKQQ